MAMSSKAKKIHAQVSKEGTKLGDLRKIAKELKRDHALAMELWQTGELLPRQLAILLMDKKKLTQEVIDELDAAIREHPPDERDHLSDWLMANQLSKDKKTVALMKSWRQSASPMQRRLFWYHQARLRWMGKPPPDDDSAALLDHVEADLAGEAPEVQWAMNFMAGWIGVFEPELRARCVALGEAHGLYEDERVPKNCTPAYLPEFIRIEAGKREKP